MKCQEPQGRLEGMIGVAWILAVALLPVAAGARVDEAFFEARVRPVLAAECLECHGPGRAEGGLRLDWRGGWEIGGDSGPAIRPGDPEGSLFLQALRHQRSDLRMPKEGAKLEDRVLADLAAWIAAGAPDPRAQPAAAAEAGTWEDKYALRRQWWCFQPVTDPAPPAVRRTGWPRDPVDTFLLAAQESRGLGPGPDTDPGLWYRRVAFALTGLPPEPDAQAAFLADAAPDARARAVDRLLASPRFGERWARHWMDLFRYAETHGSEGDPATPNAWRYRDYLIRAFNADVPLDQLIREHVAGDLLPQPRRNREEGLDESRLGVAALPLHEHGFQPVDTLDEQTRSLENQIDTLFKAFQGLTLACARCHDHKFDPLSQRDYTALVGVLASSRPTQHTVDLPETLLAGVEELSRSKDALRAALAERWRAEAAGLADWLHPVPDPAAVARTEARRATLAALRTEAAAWLASAPPGEGPRVPAPVWRWDFAGDPPGGTLFGGARVEGGRLHLDGREAYFQSAAIDRDLGARTLEAWVALATLDQRGGGVVTVESGTGTVFDALVFAEKHPRRWMAGSDFYRRGRAAAVGEEETAGPDTLVHLAVTQAADGTIALFRNGEPYGPPYRPDFPAQTYRAGDGRLLLGRRHTGGGNAFLRGTIDEARVYDRALTPEEVRASHRAGPDQPGGDGRERLPPATRERLAHLERQIAALEGLLASEGGGGDAAREELLRAAAAQPRHALHRFARPEAAIPAAPVGQARVLLAPTAEAHRAGFHHGAGLAAPRFLTGDFTPEPAGDRALRTLWPAGTFTASLSRRQNGVFATPRFRIDSDRLFVRAAGGGGAQVRLIPDNYPLGINSTYPRAELKADTPAWITLDTAYRRGTDAYLEFTTAGDATRDGAGDGPSWFWVGEVRAGGPGDTPREGIDPPAALRETAGEDPARLARRHADAARDAVEAWARGELDEPGRAYLQGLLDCGRLTAPAEVFPDREAFRMREAQLPKPRRAPGLAEGTAFDAPFLARGNHLRPGEPVPRGFPRVLGGRSYSGPGSGRLDLAQDLTHPGNPLTARVMANRIWHHLFGLGLVATPDNFGRLGEPPSHPELLDHLATRLVREGWSLKRLVRALVLSRAYGLDSGPADGVREVDPANVWLTHFRLRRLDAEAVRDSLLAVSGRLDLRMGGPGDPADRSRRRSVYLSIRRNQLPEFLTAFDFPPPAFTRGQRDATNVPAQSLALLNSPFVHAAAEALAGRESDPDRLFAAAFARPPTEREREWIRAHVAAGATPRDLALSFFNAKEFIYVR
jgi:cytochrome c553